MKTLNEILPNGVLQIEGDTDLPIENISLDSRLVAKNTLFAAIKGNAFDGHAFIEKAIEKGAVAILCEQLPQNPREEITYMITDQVRLVLGEILKKFFENPSTQLKLIGVTGTNGKTTIATLCFNLFKRLGYKVGLISTIENKIDDQVLSTKFTTPDNITLNQLLRQMVDTGLDYVFMEVSSHAIDQQRIAGLSFAGGVFTNLTHDHLDYHKDFKSYLNAKKMFFDHLPPSAFALTNVDDKNGRVMVQNCKASIAEYSLTRMSRYRAKVLQNSLEGLSLELDGSEFHTKLAGLFNAYNLLAVYGVADLLGIEKLQVLQALSEVNPAEGRFDLFVDKVNQRSAIVDYAHTPDALEKVLKTIRAANLGKGKVITVVGCGGDRDRTKRPIMAEIAAKLSDRLVITSDNPRTEDPESILDDMESGLEGELLKKMIRITDRKQAIRTACRFAERGDVILVAGKGHEKYVEVNGVRTPFDDKEILKAAMLEDI